MTTPPIIRAAMAADLPVFQDIERAAGRVFHDVGMAAVAEDEPLSVATLRDYQADARAWTVTDEAGSPIAYLIVDDVDGNAHVEQVSVHPDHARRGVGRALIEHVANWADACGYPALTLTTFVDVPWNAPYYERCGFRRLADDEITPGLAAIREHEAAAGLDRWPRCCMRLDLAS